MVQLYVLYEHASGYCLFQVTHFEEVGAFLAQVEASTGDATKFKHVVKLLAYRPFVSAPESLDNVNAISEGVLTEVLKGFLQINLPNAGKSGILGVCEPKLGAAISEALSIQVTHIGVVPEITRGIRFHLCFLIKKLTKVFARQTELGLGHAYSRCKVKFNVHRVDNMIMQSIGLVDQMEKDVNLFAMRIREWYSYHFPELAKVVTDNYMYAQCAQKIGDRTKLTPELFDELDEITGDSSITQGIYDASRMSMGMDIAPMDLLNIKNFAKRVVSLSKFKTRMFIYLKSKMNSVAPNLSALIGDVVGARLISHAGSLTNLAKCPASTVQILGAEKALFRALKARSSLTPKYGLIYHSHFIGRAVLKNKGRISRFLANKCSIATRIDCFSDYLSSTYGEMLNGQVEDRLKFYETGIIPMKNEEVMALAHKKLNSTKQRYEAQDIYGNHVSTCSSKKKRKKSQMMKEEQAQVGDNNDDDVMEIPKKKKKKSKSKEDEDDLNLTNGSVNELDDSIIDNPALEGSVKKKKKSKKTREAE